MKEIVEIQLKYLGKHLAESKIKLNLTEKAKKLLAERGFDPVYGARPLRRTIQKMIVNPLSKKILAGEFKGTDEIKIDTDKKDEELVLS